MYTSVALSSPKYTGQYCENWYWGNWAMLKVVRWT